MSEFGVDLTIESVARHARREAFREVVEALRGMHYHDYLDAEAAAGRELQSDEFKDAADFIESRFLSPDREEER